MQKNRLKSFSYIANSNAEILILGSMPGEESLRQVQYYAHPRNLFWKLMSEIFDFSIDLDYNKKLKALTANKIALWDVVSSCIRDGSMDTNIKKETINDFDNFFLNHKNICKILFNGQKAHHIFKKQFDISNIKSIKIEIMPSTSPANASIKYQAKLLTWKRALDFKINEKMEIK